MRIVLVTRDRPELTRQTIETMKANAADWSKHELVVVFDGTWKEVFEVFKQNTVAQEPILISGGQVGVGGAKNIGVRPYIIKGLEPDDILLFSDNDMYYLPGWDTRLEKALIDKTWAGQQITQLGGWKHPFHHGTSIDGLGYNNEQRVGVDAVTGNCFGIRWSDWLKYGPFDANAIGPGQSEDYALSQKIKAGGGIVATLDPPVAIHCGLANCLGEPATGYQEMAAMAEAQMKEYGIDKIWLATPDEGTILIERTVGRPVGLVHGFKGLNIGSGQRRFDMSAGWINVDCVSRPPDQVPDVVLDATKLVDKFGENTQDMVVLHHVLEHFGCGEADEVLRQCYKVLKPGGSLLIFVPDMQKLAARWLGGEIDDYIFFVNTYGAYQGEDGDRHKWNYSRKGLEKYLRDTCGLIDCQCAEPTCIGENGVCPYGDIIKDFDWRKIEGADIAGPDWWIMGVEVIKGS